MDERNLFDWQSGDLIEEGKMNLINKSIRDIWIQLDELSTETGEISIEALQVKYEVEHNNSLYFNVQDFLDYVSGKLLNLDKKDTELLETIKNKKVSVDEIEYKTETYVTLKDFLDSIQAILQEMSDEMDLTIETVNDMNKKVINVTEGFNEVETEVISVKNSIKLVNSTIDLIKADMEALQNKKIDISEISYVNGTYITLKSFLDYVGSKLNSLDSKDTELNNAITVLRNAITTLQNKKYNATDITFTHETYTTVDTFVRYLERTLDAVGTDVEGIKETLETIEEELDIDVYTIKYTKRDCITLGNYLDFVDVIIDDLYDITDELEENKADKSYVEENYVTNETFDELELIETSDTEPTDEDVVIWINTAEDNKSSDILARINDDTVASSTTWSSGKIKDTIINFQIGNGNVNGGNIDMSDYAKKDDIPTHISQLTNDRGFITSVPSEYITATELNAKNYATKGYVDEAIADIQLEEMDLSSYATKKYVDDAIEEIDVTEQLKDYAKKTDIPTVPTKLSQLTNDSNYISSIPNEYVTETELNNKGYLTSIPNEYITETELNAKGYLTQHQDLSAYAKKTDIPTVPTKVSQLTNDSNYVTQSYVKNEIANAQLGGEDTEIDLSGYATKDELNAKADVEDIPTKTSQLTNDSNYISSIPNEYITEIELNAKGYLTQHQSLTDYAKKNEVPTKTSQLTNDSNYINSIPSEYITETELNNKGYLTQHQDLTDYAKKSELHEHSNKSILDGITSAKINSWNNKSTFSGNYNDLTNKPTIPTVPTKTSQLTNDSNFITSVPSEYITETELANKNYATKEYVNQVKTGTSSNAILISEYDTPSNGDYTSILQSAINKAVEENKKIVFDKGVYKISGVVNCPDNCTIEIEGSSDAFANSMNRYSKVLSGVTLWYENINNETLILYTDIGTLFKVPGGEGKGTMFKFKNLSFRNAVDETSNYLLRARIVGQTTVQSSSKGKVYAENCLFAGFKVCFGDKYVTDSLEQELSKMDGRTPMTAPTTKMEKCCFVGSRCRFVACGCSVNLGVDCRFVDCSFNNGWYGIVFQEDSGISTVSNCRLEWLKLNGVYADSCHDITIIGNEFDKIGWAGVHFTNNTGTNIGNNVFRRCGADENYDYTAVTKNTHIYVENCTGGVVNSNVTVQKSISDSGDAVKRPSNSVCIRNNNSIVVVGNDFTGCTTGTNNKLVNNTNSSIGYNLGINLTDNS